MNNPNNPLTPEHIAIFEHETKLLVAQGWITRQRLAQGVIEATKAENSEAQLRGFLQLAQGYSAGFNEWTDKLTAAGFPESPEVQELMESFENLESSIGEALNRKK